ncbi:hypothetical protein [Anaerosacchariphilus polymeriproducens]|uniref:Uncharacterized protein n=1 Tax=Anaerosacchariphilus polymeriproducens TaxID=1812858 RepID=A0A371ARG7_9FIRM|nr:hypothetical protein [Anaerosacchariphilus polymeriproducens]RDU22132.1 hypothetical protein DWV06_16515 [Anaerosacchariphilus polymeriproducens]
MKLRNRITPKTLRIFFLLGVLGCLGVLVISYIHPKKTLFAAQTLSSLNEESYFSEPVSNNTKYDLELSANNVPVEFIGFYMATDTRVVEKGTIHYHLIEKSTSKSVYSGEVTLAGVGHNSFLLLPFLVKEPLNGAYQLQLTFSDIDSANPPAFWITPEKYHDISCQCNGEKLNGNLISIIYNHNTTRPLVWDCIFTLCVLGTVFCLLPKNPRKERKTK